MAPTLKLVYFALPGRAEPIRLAALLGGLNLEFAQVEAEGWGALKPEVAPRQLPVLYVDGKVFGQSLAQLRYVGKLAKLYPEDALEALEVDELIDNVTDVFGPIMKTMALQDEEQKKAARAEALAPGGGSHTWLAFIDRRLAGRKYAVGDKLTIADIAIFVQLQALLAGFLDHIPATALDEFTHIKAHRNLIANIDKIKAHYANADGLRAVYRA